VKLTVTWPLPAVTETIAGAPGAKRATLNDCVTGVAARYAGLPDWSALIEQLPVVTKLSVVPVIEQTPGVVDVKVTMSPELAVAVSIGDVPKVWVPGFANVIVCGPFGITLLDAADGALGPAELVAVTVKVYAVPLARLFTVIEVHGAAQAPVMPPGDDVAVKLVIGLPAELKVMVALALPAVATPIVGALGAAGVTANDRVTVGAGR
jgi:hypothetical protein